MADAQDHALRETVRQQICSDRMRSSIINLGGVLCVP